jgi:hypothetical protein
VFYVYFFFFLIWFCFWGEGGLLLQLVIAHRCRCKGTTARRSVTTFVDSKNLTPEEDVVVRGLFLGKQERQIFKKKKMAHRRPSSYRRSRRPKTLAPPSTAPRAKKTYRELLILRQSYQRFYFILFLFFFV